MPARRLRRRLAVGVAVFTGYLLGAVAVTAGAWRGPATGWAGGCCDQEPAIWYLGWVPHALAHGLDPFFTTQIGAPAGVNLMWNPSMPLLGVLSWLPTRIGGPVFGFNVAMTAGIALSALTAWLAIRRWTGDGAGPIVGGAVYGFSPFVVSHAALHLNLASAWVVPLLLIAVDEVLVTRRHPPRRAGAVLGALATAQLLISEEVLATGVVAAAVWLGVLAAARRIRPPTATVGAGLSTAMATFLLLAGWPLLAQFRGPQRLTRPVQDPTVFSTDLLNLVVPTPYQLVAPGTGPGFSGLTHEATAYLGVPLLLVVIAAMIRFRDDPRIRVAGPTGAALFVLSLGPWLHVGTRRLPVPLPWWPLQKLPLLEHALPGRLTVYVWLSVAFVVGVVVARVRHLARPQAAPWLSAIAAGLLVVLPAPLPRAPFSTPAFFRNWSTHHIAADETVLVAPYFVNGSEAAPMVWAAQTRYRLRMPEAYAYVPQPGGGTYSGPAQSQLTYTMYTIQQSGRWLVARGGIRTQIADDLAAADIRHVVVGPTLNWQPLVAFFTDLFGRPPDLTDGVAIWRDVNARGVAAAPSH